MFLIQKIFFRKHKLCPNWGIPESESNVNDQCVSKW